MSCVWFPFFVITSYSIHYTKLYDQETDTLTGLTHATGISLTANERWNMGANTDIGTLTDAQTGAQTKRKAGGVRVGYGLGSLQLSSGVEYRLDETELLDTRITSYNVCYTKLLRMSTAVNKPMF